MLFTTKRKIVLPHEMKLPFAKRYLLRELQPPPMASVARVYIILPFPRVSILNFETVWRIYLANFCECVFDLYARTDCLSGSCGSRSRGSKTPPPGQVLACHTRAPGAEIDAPCACSMCCTWDTSIFSVRKCCGIICG